MKPAKLVLFLIYVICGAAGAVLGLYGVSLGDSDPDSALQVLYISFIPIIASGIIFLILIYQMYAAIQSPDIDTVSPGKAVGFLFIPIFDIYWICKIFGGYPQTFNTFLSRRQINVRQLSTALFVTYLVSAVVGNIAARVSVYSSYVFDPLNFILAAVIVYQVCNRLSALQQPQAQPAEQPVAPPV